MRKQIDLPKTVIEELKTQAKGIHAKMKVKPYIELILTEQAQSKKTFKPNKK